MLKKYTEKQLFAGAVVFGFAALAVAQVLEVLVDLVGRYGAFTFISDLLLACSYASMAALCACCAFTRFAEYKEKIKGLWFLPAALRAAPLVIGLILSFVYYVRYEHGFSVVLRPLSSIVETAGRALLTAAFMLLFAKYLIEKSEPVFEAKPVPAPQPQQNAGYAWQPPQYEPAQQPAGYTAQQQPQQPTYTPQQPTYTPPQAAPQQPTYTPPQPTYTPPQAAPQQTAGYAWQPPAQPVQPQQPTQYYNGPEGGAR